MSHFYLEDRTRRLLAAQANLNGTFNHTCRATVSGQQLAFRLQVERNTSTSNFVVDVGGERHSITLPHDAKRLHLRLADFIVAIVNGRADTGEPGINRIAAHPAEAESLLDTEQQHQLHRLLLKGGVRSVHVGPDQPLYVAVHRTRARLGATVILSIGKGWPHTSCFTVYGHDSEAMERLMESIKHLAAVATLAADAA